MGKPRKPTGILDLGNWRKKDPKRAKAREKEPEGVPGLGDPPAYMVDENERARWAELVEMVPAGVMQHGDRAAAVQLCRLWAKGIRGELSIGGEKLLAQVLRSFGLTPSARSEVPSPTKKSETNKPENPFGRLA